MFLKRFALLAASAFLALPALAQYQDAAPQSEAGKVVLTLEDALKIALSENTSVKVADMEIERQQYARKGSYAALLPQVSASGMYSYALKKQKVYFGSDKQDDDGEGSSGGGGMAGMMASLMNPIMYYIEQLYAGTGVPFVPYVDPDAGKEGSGGSSEPMEMGRTHSVTFGLSAQMPVVNFQLSDAGGELPALGEPPSHRRPGGTGRGAGTRVPPRDGRVREAGFLWHPLREGGVQGL